MKLVLLGTTGYHPSATRHTACLMFPELGLVLDAGTAMFRVRDWLQTTTLDIFLTHAHLDHVIGLTFLFDVLYGRQMDQVRVHGAPPKLQAIEQHLFASELFPAKPPFTWEPLDGPWQLPDGGRLTHFPVAHPGGAVAFRIDWPGRSFAYVTDTTAREDAPYVEKIRDVDLLVHECYFPDGYEADAARTGHSCLSPVLDVALAARAKRLILVHVNPLATEVDPLGLEDARVRFPELQLGVDGMEVEV